MVEDGPAWPADIASSGGPSGAKLSEKIIHLDGNLGNFRGPKPRDTLVG
jgi:hypothetical protein